jgi:hypothetical protein
MCLLAANLSTASRRTHRADELRAQRTGRLYSIFDPAGEHPQGTLTRRR